MNEIFFTYCANCGKQVLIEDNTSICYWCHKNASKKEEITMERCPRCGLAMYMAMKGCGPQVWVCSDPGCGRLVRESK